MATGTLSLDHYPLRLSTLNDYILMQKSMFPPKMLFLNQFHWFPLGFCLTGLGSKMTGLGFCLTGLGSKMIGLGFCLTWLGAKLASQWVSS